VVTAPPFRVPIGFTTPSKDSGKVEMEKEAFLQLLAAEGFGTVVEVEREAFGTLDSHAHNFEAMALVLHGSLVIRKSDGDFTYNSGDIFHLECNQPHSEVFGEHGVRYLVGRK